MTGFTDLSCTCCAADGINFQKTVILTSLFVYIGGYQVGFGPISWLLISEIFPLEVRGKAVSIAVVTNFFWNTVVTFLFPVELEYIGSAPTFYVYAGVLIAGIYFIYKKVPETKGMSLEEIEEFFVHSSKDFLDTEGSTNSNSRSSSEKLEGKDNCEAKDFNERLSSLI
jgi:MFS family permease